MTFVVILSGVSFMFSLSALVILFKTRQDIAKRDRLLAEGLRTQSQAINLLLEEFRKNNGGG